MRSQLLTVGGAPRRAIEYVAKFAPDELDQFIAVLAMGPRHPELIEALCTQLERLAGELDGLSYIALLMGIRRALGNTLSETHCHKLVRCLAAGLSGASERYPELDFVAEDLKAMLALGGSEPVTDDQKELSTRSRRGTGWMSQEGQAKLRELKRLLEA